MFVRRSRYEALRKDLAAWQAKESDAQQQRKEAEREAEAHKEESRKKGKLMADYAQKMSDARGTIIFLRAKLKEIGLASLDIGEKAHGLSLQVSPASESVLEDA